MTLFYNLFVIDENVWMTQELISELFGKGKAGAQLQNTRTASDGKIIIQNSIILK